MIKNKPRTALKEMAAPQAKFEVRSLIDKMKDSISLQKYVTFKYPFPASVVLKNPSAANVTFNLMMSFSLSPKDKNYHLSAAVDSAFEKCWNQVKRMNGFVDVRVRGANVFISTDSYDDLEKCVDEFLRLWKNEEYLLIKKLA